MVEKVEKDWKWLESTDNYNENDKGNDKWQESNGMA